MPCCELLSLMSLLLFPLLCDSCRLLHKVTTHQEIVSLLAVGYSLSLQAEADNL